MRGWTSMLVGFLLLGLAYWSFATDGIGSSMLLFGAAAAFFFFRGAQGQEVGKAGDPTAVVDFVTDPADAIVDTVTDQISDWFNDREPKATAVDEQPKFDADAALARYLAQRGPEAAAVASVSPVPRGFGRKGLQ